MMRRGDIVIVDFPFSDRTGSRVRPALVVQADDLNRSLDDTVLVMITSSSRRVVGHASQLLVDSAHPDYQRAGFKTDSLIQCNILLTLDQALILKTIGSLSGATMLQVDACLKSAMGMP